MGRGPVTTMVSTTNDLSAPGGVAFSQPLIQTSNTEGTVGVLLPTLDSDGSPLTGLRHVTVGVVKGNDPYAGMSADVIVAQPDVQLRVVSLTDADAGTAKIIPVPIIQPGEVHTLYAWADDDL